MAQASSTVFTVQAPVLSGVWIHDPADPANTIAQFIYGNVGRTEDISVASTAISYIGRALPVYDMGSFESQELQLNIVIPASDDEQDLVEWFRVVVRNRHVLCYRDNRGRLTYGIIGSVSFTDAREGTVVEFTFITADFSEAI